MITSVQPSDDLCINTIRTLSIDAGPESETDIRGCRWARPRWRTSCGCAISGTSSLRAKWRYRDRWVLSSGHASLSLYSMLFLTGYHLTMDDIKRFRQWGSRTPGHPEYGVVPGAEVTTGARGQGDGNALGYGNGGALAGRHMQRAGHEVVNHQTKVMGSDGDMMEGRRGRSSLDNGEVSARAIGSRSTTPKRSP